MPLYLVDSTTDALHTVNRANGLATRVGMATQFDAGINVPSALYWDGATLFMLGYDALYSLDFTTGVAVRIGTAINFGVGESRGNGLAWDGTSLFMVGQDTRALYTLDRTTGVATRVGSATVFGLEGATLDGQGRPSGLTWNGTDLYLAVQGLTSFVAALCTLDRTTGIATRVSNVVDFGNQGAMDSLAWDGTTLYAASGDGFYSISLTGVALLVGTLGSGIGRIGSRGLVWIPGSVTPVVPPTDPLTEVHYAIGSFSNALYTVDRYTGEISRVGNAVDFGLIGDPNTSVKGKGLDWDGNTLYLSTDDALYTLSRITGVATLVARYAGNFRVRGMAWNGTNMHLLAETNFNAIYIVDRMTADLARLRFIGVLGGEARGLTFIGDRAYTVGVEEQSLIEMDLTLPPPVELEPPTQYPRIGLNIANRHGADFEASISLGWDGESIYMFIGERYYRLGDEGGLGVRGDTVFVNPFTGPSISENGIADFDWVGSPPPKGDVFYMTGLSQQSLCRVNKVTGVARFIRGQPGGLYKGEKGMRGGVWQSGIRWDGTTLWTIEGGRLRQVGLETGDATSGVPLTFAEGFPPEYVFSLRLFAWNGTNLYGVVDWELFIIDRDTGVCTFVVNKPGWGAGIQQGAGTAWDGDNLYILGSSALFTLDLFTGVASRVSDVINFGWPNPEFFRISGDLGWDGENLYCHVSTSAGSRTLGVINKETGEGNFVVERLPLLSYWMGENYPASLEWVGAVSNHAPSWENLIVDYYLGRNVPIGSVIAHFSAIDIDGDDLTYSLGASSIALFELINVPRQDGPTLKTVAALVNGSEYLVDIIASDGTLTDTLTVKVHVDADSDLRLGWVSPGGLYEVSADITVGDEIVNLSAVSDSANAVITYALLGRDKMQFALDAMTGSLTVARPLVTGNTYYLQAVATADNLVSVSLSLHVIIPVPVPPPDPTLPDPSRPTLDETQPDVTPSSVDGNLLPEQSPIFLGRLGPQQVQGFHRYRERFDVLQPNTTTLVVLNVEMIREQHVQELVISSLEALRFGAGVVKLIPVYPILTIYIGDWIILHGEREPLDGPLRVPDPTRDDVLVVRGFEELGDIQKQVILCTPL